MNQWHLNSLTTNELLRVVDRSNPEVKELARRLEVIDQLNVDFCAACNPQDKEDLDDTLRA